MIKDHKDKIALVTGSSRGLGKYLLEKLLEVLKNNSLNSIFLEVRPSNKKAIDLYSRFGFCIIGRRRGYYPAKYNREDALVMKRLVNLKWQNMN